MLEQIYHGLHTVNLKIPLNSGRTAVSGSSIYIGDSSNLPCRMACMSDIPEVTQYVHPANKVCNYNYVHPSTKQCNYSYTHPSAIQCSAATEINSLKSSVSNGKSLIASAITGKGVSTSSSATFQTMANNISSLPSPEFETLFFSGQWVFGANELNSNINTPIPLPRAFTFQAEGSSVCYMYVRDTQILYTWEFDDTAHWSAGALETKIEKKTEQFWLSSVPTQWLESSTLFVNPVNKTWYLNDHCTILLAIY